MSSTQQAEVPVAFVALGGEVVVNFGILTGREATIAEVDRLSHLLAHTAGPELEITSRRLHSYAREVETVVHQVAVAPCAGDPAELARLCQEWALDCAADRRLEPLDG